MPGLAKEALICRQGTMMARMLSSAVVHFSSKTVYCLKPGSMFATTENMQLYMKVCKSVTEREILDLKCRKVRGCSIPNLVRMLAGF